MLASIPVYLLLAPGSFGTLARRGWGLLRGLVAPSTGRSPGDPAKPRFPYRRRGFLLFCLRGPAGWLLQQVDWASARRMFRPAAT